MSNPFVTIGIASYNYAHFLPRAFEAIKRQKFKNFEILYCDDGSTDNSVEIIKCFIRDNPDMDIRLIEGKNQGVMANKNRILENTRGEYLMLCDADDWMDDDCLEKLTIAAKSDSPDRVIAGFRNVIEKNEILSVGQIEYIPPHPSKWVQFQHHGGLYRTSVFRKNNITFREDRYPDDFDFITRYNYYCSKVVFLSDVLYNFYHNGASASSEPNPQKPWYYLNVLNGISSVTEEVLPKLGKPDALELEASVVRIFYAQLPNIKTEEERKKFFLYLNRCAPNYKNNPLLLSVNRSPFRRDAALKTRILITIDKIGLLPVFSSILSKK